MICHTLIYKTGKWHVNWPCFTGTIFKYVMKTIILFTSLCIASCAAYAQKSNVIFFSQGGEKFTVVMNGLKMNEAPETNVRVTELNAPNYMVKIIFEDTKLGEISKNLLMGDGLEITWNIKKNKKGEYVLAFNSQVELAQAPLPPSNQRQVNFTQVPPSNTIVIQETISTTTNTNTNGVGVNANVGGAGVNIQMNVNDPFMNGSSTTTTTTTYSTTTTTGNTGTVVYDNTGNPNNTGSAPCSWPMSSTDFRNLKSSVSSKSFEDSKLTVAKQALGSNCLSSAQIKEMMLVFSYEDSRLDFAKNAYSRCTDPNNYFTINDAFSFESSIEDLNKYIGR